MTELNILMIDAAWDLARQAWRIAGNASMVEAGREVWSSKDLRAARKAEDEKLNSLFSDRSYTKPRRKRR